MDELTQESGESVHTSEYSEEQLRHIVESGSEGGTVIIPSPYNDSNLPQVNELVLPQKLNEREREMAYKYLDYLRIYACTPIVADHFPDHAHREAFQQQELDKVRAQAGEETEAKLRHIFDENKLSGNRIGYTSQAIHILEKSLHLPLPQNEVDTIKTSVFAMRKMQEAIDERGLPYETGVSKERIIPWNELSQEERISFVNDIGSSAAKIILEFTPGWRMQAE